MVGLHGFRFQQKAWYHSYSVDTEIFDNPELLIFTERYLLETYLELYLNPSKATFAIILFDSALETISSIILPILPVAILGHEPVLHQWYWSIDSAKTIVSASRDNADRNLWQLIFWTPTQLISAWFDLGFGWQPHIMQCTKFGSLVKAFYQQSGSMAFSDWVILSVPVIVIKLFAWT